MSAMELFVLLYLSGLATGLVSGMLYHKIAMRKYQSEEAKPVNKL